MPESVNFTFTSEYDSIFLQLASAAERAFASDPNTTLIKLRQLGEALAAYLLWYLRSPEVQRRMDRQKRES